MMFHDLSAVAVDTFWAAARNLSKHFIESANALESATECNI